jgi:hypothetical protein
MGAPGQYGAYLEAKPVTVRGILVRPGDPILCRRSQYAGKRGRYLARFKDLLLCDVEGAHSQLYLFPEEVFPVAKNTKTSAGQSHLVSR